MFEVGDRVIVQNAAYPFNVFNNIKGVITHFRDLCYVVKLDEWNSAILFLPSELKKEKD